MRRVRFTTIHPPATPWGTLWGRCGVVLVALLYLLAGNLHTCELGIGQACCPQTRSIVTRPTHSLSGKSARPSATDGMPNCCHQSQQCQLRSSHASQGKNTAGLSGRERCETCGFCLAQLLHNTPLQASTVFALQARVSSRLVSALALLFTTPLGVVRLYDGRGPPFEN